MLSILLLYSKFCHFYTQLLRLSTVEFKFQGKFKLIVSFSYPTFSFQFWFDTQDFGLRTTHVTDLVLPYVAFVQVITVDMG